MLKSTRAALAIGLGLLGVAGLVGRSVGQEGVRQAAGTQPSGPPPHPPAIIGTIDLDQVLRAYDKAKYLWEAGQAEATAKQGEMMKLANEGQQEVEKLKKLAPGSLDQKRIETKLSNIKAQIAAIKEQAGLELNRKDAESMASIYNDIQRMAGAVARQRNISMIVRFNATPPSPTDPRTVEAAMFNSVVFADPKLDLTKEVIQWLNYYYKKDGGPMPKGDPAVAGPGQPAPAGPGAGTAPAATEAAQPRASQPR